MGTLCCNSEPQEVDDDMFSPLPLLGEELETRKSVSVCGKRSSILISIKRMESIYQVENKADTLPRINSEQHHILDQLDDPFDLKPNNPLL